MQSVSFTEQNKHVIKIVEKRKKIQVGDYCVFQCLDDSHDFLIGRVLSFVLENNTKKSAAMWEWDADSRNIGKMCALCDWYKAEEIENNVTGKLTEYEQSILGFHSCDKYVCSVPDPRHTQVGESRNLLFDATTAKHLTEF
jgi:hypothetical protein